jgi:hypothetical protein
MISAQLCYGCNRRKKRSLASQKREAKMDGTGNTFKKWMKMFLSWQLIGQQIQEAETYKQEKLKETYSKTYQNPSSGHKK